MTSRLIFTEKGHRYSLDGERVPSVSTTLNKAIAKPGLQGWYARSAAEWAATHSAELRTSLDEDAWVSLAAGEANRRSREGRDNGTLLHYLAESLVYGEPLPAEDENGLPYPDDIVRSAEQLARFFDEWEVEPLAHEAYVFNETHRWAGRLDLIADLVDGERWLLDYKTGKSGVWEETSLQLCAYGHATHIVIDDVDHPMPQVTRAGAVWVRPDSYRLVPLKYDDDTYAVFGHALHVARWISQPREEIVGAPLPVPERAA